MSYGIAEIAISLATLWWALAEARRENMLIAVPLAMSSSWMFIAGCVHAGVF